MNKPLSKPVAQSRVRAGRTPLAGSLRREPTGTARSVANRSGIEVKALYTPEDWSDARYLRRSAFPGEYPNTRGIYACMHRGRTLDPAPADRPRRTGGLQRAPQGVLAPARARSRSIPCNSVFRGFDADEVPDELLGTCGAVVNTVDDMARALADMAIDRSPSLMNDPSPFTLLRLRARRRATARRAWNKVTGTSNQSDCISHFVANHMFFRLALPGARRVLVDHIRFCNDRGARLEPAVSGRPAHAAGRRDAGRGDGLHPGLGDPVRRGLPGARHGARRLPAALHVLLRHLASASSRRSPSSVPGGACGRASRASALAPRTPRPGASSSTPRPRAST